MKKLLFFVVVLLSTQIVNAQLHDATLKQKGTQNEASTVAWLQSMNPDPNLIHMPLESFNTEFKKSLTALNEKYGTFPAITDDVINEIVSKLFTKDMDPGAHRLSWYDSENGKWGSWKRERKTFKNGEVETGLYFPGWKEPVFSVYCWNFGYPDDTAPVVPSSKTVVKVIPGINTYTYKTDTIRERNDFYKEVENNNFITKNNNTFTRINNQSVTVDMTEKNINRRVVDRGDDCNCGNQREVSCGCDGRRICDDHYERLPKKDKKKFFNTAGGRVLTHTAAAVGGYFLGRWIFGDVGGQVIPGQVITQGPFETLPNTTPIFTQGPLQTIFN